DTGHLFDFRARIHARRRRKRSSCGRGEPNHGRPLLARSGPSRPASTSKGRWVQIVGVAADSKYESMRQNPKPFFYVPLRQDFVRGPVLYIRTTQLLQTMQAALLREVRALDANLALYEMITLQEQVDRSTSPQLVAVTLVATLGGLALVLASIG